MLRKVVVMTGVLVMTGWLVSVAAACHADVTASMDCNGVVHWSATSWAGTTWQNGRDMGANADIRVFAGTTQVGSGSFSRSSGYSFGGDWQAPAGVDHVT